LGRDLAVDGQLLSMCLFKLKEQEKSLVQFEHGILVAGDMIGITLPIMKKIETKYLLKLSF